jgi:hypothetical protein
MNITLSGRPACGADRRHSHLESIAAPADYIVALYLISSACWGYSARTHRTLCDRGFWSTDAVPSTKNFGLGASNSALRLGTPAN